jgi:hypothetical protein
MGVLSKGFSAYDHFEISLSVVQVNVIAHSVFVLCYMCAAVINSYRAVLWMCNESGTQKT